MKILQLSDLHLLKPGMKIGEINPLERLNNAINHINKYHQNADFCAVTGDIADQGEQPAYQVAKEILDTLKVDYYPIIGNHDQRATFLSTFTDTPSADGFINYKIEQKDQVFLFLDTVFEHHDHGQYCETREKWLKKTLNGLPKGKPIFIFMHHPPFSVCIDWIDQIGLAEGEKFYTLIKNYPIRFLFFGHIHRPSMGIWHEIPYCSNRAIGHYQLCTHNELNYDYPMTLESPMYSVINIRDNQVHIDLQDFTHDEIAFNT